jgi:hypothetical protein
MLAEDILDKVRKEDESFLKRKNGLVKKTEPLGRVWPLCDIYQQIFDRVTGLWYFFLSTDKELSSLLYFVGLSPCLDPIR